MAVQLNPYLNFAGDGCRAMAFYHSIFGGELETTTFADAGMGDQMPAEGLMHGRLTTPDFVIMASDAMPGEEKNWGGTRNYISLSGTDEALLRGWFAKLSDGGQVGMELAPQSWGALYGLCTDRYGIEWMVNIEAD